MQAYNLYGNNNKIMMHKDYQYNNIGNITNLNSACRNSNVNNTMPITGSGIAASIDAININERTFFKKNGISEWFWRICKGWVCPPIYLCIINKFLKLKKKTLHCNTVLLVLYSFCYFLYCFVVSLLAMTL